MDADMKIRNRGDWHFTARVNLNTGRFVDSWLVGFIQRTRITHCGTMVRGIIESDISDPNFKPRAAVFGTKSSLWWVELETKKIFKTSKLYDNGNKNRYWKLLDQEIDKSSEIYQYLLSSFQNLL